MKNINCFQKRPGDILSAQLCLCQLGHTFREYTQIKYRFLEVADLDFSDVWLGIF